MLIQAWCLGWGWEAVEPIHFESKDNRTSRWASCGVRQRKAARSWPGTPEGAGRMESGGGGSHNSETSERSPSLSLGSSPVKWEERPPVKTHLPGGWLRGLLDRMALNGPR